MKKAVVAGKDLRGGGSTTINGTRRELLRMPDSHQIDTSSNQYASQNNDNFISSESDRQLLLIKYILFLSFLLLLSLVFFFFVFSSVLVFYTQLPLPWIDI